MHLSADIQINRTDWARVKADATQDASIHWDEQSEPYDPNDAESVSAYWHHAIKRNTESPELMNKTPRPTASSAPAKGLVVRNQGIDMAMDNPAHPGQLLAGWLDDLPVDLVTFAARHGISLQSLSQVTQCIESISADLDRRLTEALGTTLGYWLSLQNQRDKWMAQETIKAKATKTTVASDGESE